MGCSFCQGPAGRVCSHPDCRDETEYVDPTLVRAMQASAHVRRSCCDLWPNRGYHRDGCPGAETGPGKGHTASKAFGYDYNPLHDSLHQRFNQLQELLEAIALEGFTPTRDSLVRDARTLVEMIRKDVIK